MRKTTIIFGALGLCAATFAHAQTGNFTGFSLGLNAGPASATTKFTSAGGSTTNYGEPTVATSLRAEYGFPIGSGTVFGVALNYNLADTKSGSLTASGVEFQFKQKNSYSLLLQPGFVIGENTLVYGTISYDKTTLNLSAPGFNDSEWTASGLGYGVGAKVMLTKNLYLQLEGRQTTFDEVTDTFAQKYKSSVTSSTIGIGYRF